MKTLLEMTDLFSYVSLDGNYKKLIDNGCIPDEALLDDSDQSKDFKFLLFDGNLYAIAEVRDGRIRIISRV